MLSHVNEGESAPHAWRVFLHGLPHPEWNGARFSALADLHDSLMFIS